jgi:hypothetical protein
MKSVQYTIEDDGTITFTVKACPNDLQYVPELRRWALNCMGDMVMAVAEHNSLMGGK